MEFKLRYPGINITVQTIDSREAMIDGLKQNRHEFVFDIGMRREYPGCVKAAEKNIRAASRIEFSSPGAIVRMIIQGYGRSLLPRFIVQRELDSASLIRIDTQETIPDAWSQLLYNSSKWVTPAMKAFIECTNEFFEEEYLSE